MNGEFKYEQEVRLDEERIFHYFEILPDFLDLPGENEALSERMSKINNEKVRLTGQLEGLRHVMPDCDCCSDPDIESEYERIAFRADDNEILDIIDSLALVYSERFALNDAPDAEKILNTIVCQCGKTLARISDLLYSPEDELDMKTALGKRVLRDLNDLAYQIREFAEINPDFNGVKETEILQVIRQKILNMLLEWQKI